MKRLVLILAILCAGCTSSAYKVHPGAGGYVSGAPTATQLAISQSYDTLSAADSVIQSTRTDFLAGKFPASAMPNIHNAFNALVAAYDTAQGAWVNLNASASAGGTTDQNALLAAIGALNAALQNLTSAKAAQ